MICKSHLWISLYPSYSVIGLFILKKRSLPFLGYLVRDDKTVFHWAFHPRIPLCPSYLVIGLIFGKNWEKYFRHFLFSWWKTKYGWFFVPSAWWSLSALVIQFLGYLLAPSGALVVIMVYYIYINPVFQIFQILQILMWKWKWKDPTCAIFLKSMGFKDIEYDISVYQM